MKLCNKQDVIAILWDNKDETIEEIRRECCDILSSMGYVTKVDRCFNDKSEKFDSNVLCFAVGVDGRTINEFCDVNRYIVMDVTNPIYPVMSYDAKMLFKKYKKIDEWQNT